MLEPGSKGGRRPLPLFCHLPSSQARTSATLSLQIHFAAPPSQSKTSFPQTGASPETPDDLILPRTPKCPRPMGPGNSLPDPTPLLMEQMAPGTLGGLGDQIKATEWILCLPNQVGSRYINSW